MFGSFHASYEFKWVNQLITEAPDPPEGGIDSVASTQAASIRNESVENIRNPASVLSFLGKWCRLIMSIKARSTNLYMYINILVSTQQDWPLNHPTFFCLSIRKCTWKSREPKCCIHVTLWCLFEVPSKRPSWCQRESAGAFWCFLSCGAPDHSLPL